MPSYMSDGQSPLKPLHVSSILCYLSLGTRATCLLICASRTSGRPQASPRRRWWIYCVLLTNLRFTQVLNIHCFIDYSALHALQGGRSPRRSCRIYCVLLTNLRFTHLASVECVSCFSFRFYNWIELNWTGFANVTIVGELSFWFYKWIELNWTGLATFTIELNWAEQGLQMFGELSFRTNLDAPQGGRRRPRRTGAEYTVFYWWISASYASPVGQMLNMGEQLYSL